MTGWTALVPLRLGPDSKSRLAPLLGPEARRRLVHAMAAHVIAALGQAAQIGEIVVLSPGDPGFAGTRHVRDLGSGLNPELARTVAALTGGVLVIHGDLPLLGPDDVGAMIDAANHSRSAIAPDRHRLGTNALALAEVPAGFGCAFGPDSFRRHRALLGESAAVVERPGLATDIDTPDDLAAVQGQCVFG